MRDVRTALEAGIEEVGAGWGAVKGLLQNIAPPYLLKKICSVNMYHVSGVCLGVILFVFIKLHEITAFVDQNVISSSI